MLSSVTLAFAMMAVTADAPGQPAAFRLSDYVHKSEVKAASATSSPTRAPVRMAQAPLITPSGGPATASVSSMPYPPSGFHSGAPGFHSGAPGFHSGGDVIIDSSEGFDEGYGGPGCADCGPQGWYPHYKKLGWWGMHGLPGPWHSPGDMHQHIPYLAHPKNYYYFRPYQWFHIPEQQAEVTSFGGDPRHPYANREFAEIYQEFETPPPAEFDIQPSR